MSGDEAQFSREMLKGLLLLARLLMCKRLGINWFSFHRLYLADASVYCALHLVSPILLGLMDG